MDAVNFIYSGPYLFLLAAYLVLAFAEQNFTGRMAQNTVRCVCVLIFLFFFGLRGYIGWDWHSYVGIFDNVKPLFSGDYVSNYNMSQEAGFITYISVIKWFTSDYHVFIFISSLIDVVLLGIVFKRYSVSFAMSFAVFVAFSIILEVNLLRNIKSILIFLLAVPYLQQRKIIPYMLLIALAMTFHSSAIVYVPLYFILNRKFSEKTIIVTLGLGLIIYFVQLPIWKTVLFWVTDLLDGILPVIKKSYVTSGIYGTGRGITPRIFETILFSAFVLMNYKKLVKQSESNLIFINLFFGYQIVYLYFSEMVIIVDRIGNLFNISYWIIIPVLMQQKWTFRHLIKSFHWYLARILIVSYMFAVLTVRTNNILYEYDNILFKHKSIEYRKDIFNKNASKLLVG